MLLLLLLIARALDAVAPPTLPTGAPTVASGCVYNATSATCTLTLRVCNVAAPCALPDLVVSVASTLGLEVAIIQPEIYNLTQPALVPANGTTTLTPCPPTSAPTTAPTTAPTDAPTASPTPPTLAPTQVPLGTPTAAPTAAPTAPTLAPTQVPLGTPTAAPTTAPTAPARAEPGAGGIAGFVIALFAGPLAIGLVLLALPKGALGHNRAVKIGMGAALVLYLLVLVLGMGVPRAMNAGAGVAPAGVAPAACPSPAPLVSALATNASAYYGTQRIIVYNYSALVLAAPPADAVPASGACLDITQNVTLARGVASDTFADVVSFIVALTNTQQCAGLQCSGAIVVDSVQIDTARENTGSCGVLWGGLTSYTQSGLGVSLSPNTTRYFRFVFNQPSGAGVCARMRATFDYTATNCSDSATSNYAIAPSGNGFTIALLGQPALVQTPSVCAAGLNCSVTSGALLEPYGPFSALL